MEASKSSCLDKRASAEPKRKKNVVRVSQGMYSFNTCVSARDNIGASQTLGQQQKKERQERALGTQIIIHTNSFWCMSPRKPAVYLGQILTKTGIEHARLGFDTIRTTNTWHKRATQNGTRATGKNKHTSQKGLL